MKTLVELGWREKDYDNHSYSCVDAYGISIHYDSLISSFGHEVLGSWNIGHYQGDSFFILKDDSRYGLLVFGWGSCSGCDALDAADDIKALEELRQELYDSILWDSAAGLLKTIQEKRKQGTDWYFSIDEWSSDTTRGISLDAMETLLKNSE